MAAAPEVPEDIQQKVAGNAAEQFVETYYPALNTPNLRGTIASFYVSLTTNPPLKPDISLNGNIMEDGAQVQSVYETEVDRTKYAVESFDCHVINSNYTVGLDDGSFGSSKDGSRMMIMVQISGSVEYFKESSDGQSRGFMDNVVLVPNWDSQKPTAPKGIKKWLVQSQLFRLVL